MPPESSELIITPPPATEHTDAGRDLPSAMTEEQQLDAFRRAIFAQTPWAYFTTTLLWANVGVYLWMIYRNVSWINPDPLVLIAWGANYAPKTLDGELWRLGSCMFLHVGAIHLGMNMLALWNLGRFVERLFGNLGYLQLYVLSGLAGSIASVIYNPATPSVGASGAIFGIAGALLSGTWKLRSSLPAPILRAGRWVAFNVVILFAVFAGINRMQSIARVDNAAHWAGFLIGLVCGWILAEPIPNPGRSRKGLRNAFLALAGAAGLFVAIEQFPAKPADIGLLEEKYNRVQDVVYEKLEAANGRLSARAMSGKEYAAFLETEILPRWQELADDYAQAENIPEEHRQRVADVQEMIRLNAESLELKIAAIRENDPRKDIESRKRMQQASAIMDRLQAE